MSNTKKKNNALLLLGACLFFAFLSPFHFLPFSSFYNEWLAILGVVIVFAYMVTERTVIVPITWITIIPITLAIFVAAQAFSGLLTANGDVVIPIAYFIVVAITIVLGASITAEKGGATRLCMALSGAHLAAGIASVIIASLQFMGAEAVFDPFTMVMTHNATAIRPIANIAQPNQLALLLCIAIASVWWLYQVSKLRENIAFVTVLGLLWGLAITQSRIGWVIVPSFACFVWVTGRHKVFKKISTQFVIGIVLIYAAIIAVLPHIASLLGTEVNTVVARVGTGSERVVLLQQAWQISMSHPWFGAGWYEFGPQQLKIGADFAPSGYSQHAHNIVMNFAAEVGWLLTTLVFGALAYWIFKICFRKKFSKEVGFALLVFIAISIHSMVEFPLWYAYFLMPLAFLIGMVHQEQLGSTSIKLHRVSVNFLLLILLSGVLLIAMDYRKLMSATWTAGWVSLGMQTSILSTNNQPEFTIFPHYYEYFQAKKLEIHEDMPHEKIALMERVSKRFGYVDMLERMALVYALNKRPEDANNMLNVISKLHSNYYPKIFQSWKNHAVRDPDKFGNIFKRMVKPIEQP